MFFAVLPNELLRRAARLAAAFAVVAPLAACGSFDIADYNPFGAEKYKMKVEPDVPASSIYDQGLARLAKEDGSGAAKKFTDLAKSYPDSDWSKKALLMATYSQFKAGEYDNAETSAEKYVKLYPDSPDTAYALYLEASSYYSQIPDISRDQERANKALDLYTKIVEKYPNSEYVNDSKYKIQVTRDQLAGKEMSIGRFYLKRRNFVAAINRFRTVLSNYQTTRHAEEALYPRHNQRGANRRCRPWSQLPRQPMVQRRLRASQRRRPGAGREQRILDIQDLSHGRPGLT
jgi:outer membrane protein assembly factor BamD